MVFIYLLAGRRAKRRAKTMPSALKSIITAIGFSLMLSGCLPMAFFANGGGPAYSSYASNLGVYVSNGNVNTLCLSPTLRLAIWDFEGFFGKKVVMNSGYRTPWHNAEVGGADNSFHTKCMAADIFIPGVPKEKLLAFAFRSAFVGGIGCYPGRTFIHIDVREKRNGRPTTFGGC